MSGFRRVGRLDVDAIEFDGHLAGTGELLDLHDPRLERTTTGPGRGVGDLTSDRPDLALSIRQEVRSPGLGSPA